MSISVNEAAMISAIMAITISCVTVLITQINLRRERFSREQLDFGLRQTVQEELREVEADRLDAMREIDRVRREIEMMRGLPSVANAPKLEPPPPPTPPSTPPPKLESGERHLDL